MKIALFVIGKHHKGYLEEGIATYVKRLSHYTTFELVVLPDVKNGHTLPRSSLIEKEGELICAKIEGFDRIIALDELGKGFTSPEFAAQIEKYQIDAVRKVAFVVGGAFGLSAQVLKRAHQKIGLSKMTYSHQMVRLIFLEQLYRAFTIIKGENYHH